MTHSVRTTDEVVGTFTASLDRLDVAWTRVPPDDLAGTLREVVREPAIGARLPFEGVSLPDWVTLDPTAGAVEAAATGVSPATLAVADYGSVVLPATADGAEPVSLFPELHVPVVRASDVVAGMPEAFGQLGPQLRADRDSVVFATGPSATADMGALVRGAHGPREVHVVILADEGSDADEGTDGGETNRADQAPDADTVAPDGGERR
jgi:L-lactate dehydrogenase complex protein LldG